MGGGDGREDCKDHWDSYISYISDWYVRLIDMILSNILVSSLNLQGISTTTTSRRGRTMVCLTSLVLS